MDATVRIIREHLHPEPYPEAVDGVDDVPLLLIRRSSPGSKYALAVAPYHQSQPATAQIGRVRRAVNAFTDASFFTGCGLIILFVAAEPVWPAADAKPEPDRHGLRSTIVQGLVWIDPKTGRYRMDRSAWGPLKLGNLQGQMTALQSLLDAWPVASEPR